MSRAPAPVTAPRWAQVPGVPARPERTLGQNALSAIAAVIAVIGPAGRSIDSALSDQRVVIGVGLAAGVVLILLPRRLDLLRPLVALAAGAAVYPTEGLLLALWTAVGLYAADVAIRGRSPLERLPGPTGAARVPVGILLVVAAAIGVSEGAAPRFIVLVLVAGVAATLDLLGITLLPELTERFGRWAGRATGLVTFGALGLLLVVVPWVVQRILRIDPLDCPDGRSRGWLDRQRRTAQHASPWSLEAVDGRRRPWRRVRDAVPGVAIIAAVVASVAIVVASADEVADTATSVVDEAVGDQRPPIPAQYAGDDWYWGYYDEIEWATRGRNAFQPLEQDRVADITGDYVNVRDGDRVTWQPDDLPDDHLTVWVYGGSTTWGVGQRDDHTIPSELARLADDAGIPVEVVNRGQLGDLHWREADRLSWDLSLEDPPDLVVFYDGANEVWGATQLTQADGGRSDAPVDPTDRNVWRGFVVDEPLLDDPPGSADTVPLPSIPGDARSIGESAVDRYLRSLAMSRTITEAYDIPTVHAWQPSAYSRTTPDPDDNRNTDFAPAEAYERAEELVPDRVVPEGVVDLTDAFDDVDGPLFIDNVHTNEEGAAAVAEALFAAVRPELERLR